MNKQQLNAALIEKANKVLETLNMPSLSAFYIESEVVGMLPDFSEIIELSNLRDANTVIRGYNALVGENVLNVIHEVVLPRDVLMSAMEQNVAYATRYNTKWVAESLDMTENEFRKFATANAIPFNTRQRERTCIKVRTWPEPDLIRGLMGMRISVFTEGVQSALTRLGYK